MKATVGEAHPGSTNSTDTTTMNKIEVYKSTRGYYILPVCQVHVFVGKVTNKYYEWVFGRGIASFDPLVNGHETKGQAANAYGLAQPIYCLHVYGAGTSRYRPTIVTSNSNDFVRKYYKEVEEEANRRWSKIRTRYKRAKALQQLKKDVHAEMQQSKAWREQTRGVQTSSSNDKNSQEPKSNKKDRVNPLLTSSSSSFTDG